jgi:serine-type D-Ala-D-Ala carboxypeptidase (penicillin-binding protein 5/6)
MRREGHTAGASSRRGPRTAYTVVALLCVLLGASALVAAPRRAAASTAPDISLAVPAPHAPSAIIIDRVTGRVLYGRGMHVRRPMASTTKIMTAMLALARFRDLRKRIVAPWRVTVESGIGLRPGEQITVRQALLALMLRSAQDAGVTLAFAVSGSEEAFVARMNARARALELSDTHYTNACGNVTDSSHFSSAYDLVKLSRRAMHDARFRDIVKLQHADLKWGHGRRVTVRNNNLLLHWDWADGIKSGYTFHAGICLVGSGRPSLRSFITATLGARDRQQDTRDQVALYLWASKLYEERTLLTAGQVVASVPLAGGGEVQVAARSTLIAVVRKAARAGRTLTLPARFAERPEDGAVVGSAAFRADGVSLGRVRLVVVPEAPPSPPASAPPAAASPEAASPVAAPE